MEGMTCGFLGVLAADNLGFGLALAEICQIFGQLYNMVTSLIESIWMIGKPLVAMFLVSLHWQIVVLALIWKQSDTLLTNSSHNSGMA
jgi:hypothetical protein